MQIPGPHHTSDSESIAQAQGLEICIVMRFPEALDAGTVMVTHMIYCNHRT